jgi:hypothetical protein
MPSKRINLSMFDDDVTLLNAVRDKYEKEQGKRLAYAEVVRLALKHVNSEVTLQPN